MCSFRLSPKWEDTEEDVSETPDLEKDEKLSRISEGCVTHDKVSSKFGYDRTVQDFLPPSSECR